MARLSLDDLSPVEHDLITAMMEGKELDLTGTGENVIRAELIRQLLLSQFAWPDSEQPDPRGIQLRGARLTGQLDLTYVESTLPLLLINCRTPKPVMLSLAHLPAATLRGLDAPGVEAPRIRIDHYLSLDGARLRAVNESAALDLRGARIGGALALNGARLVNSGTGPALNAEYLTTHGSILFRDGFQADSTSDRGTIRLFQARIGGNLELDGARLTNSGTGPALDAESLRTDGNVYLRDGFHATASRERGTIKLSRARIDGSLNCTAGRSCSTGENDVAISLGGAQIAADLLLPAGFARRGADAAPDGILKVDGLTYPAVPEGATLNEWLHMLANRTPQYASQPYLQLAAAHQAAGHERDVRRIRIAQQKDLIRRGDLGTRALLWHRLTGPTVGYGHRPSLALLWFVGTLALAIAVITGIAGPAGLTGHTQAYGGPNSSCTVVEQIGLALNAATPLVKPDSQQRCQILASNGLGQSIIVSTWLLQALAWAFATLFVAGFTGLVRKT